MRQFTHRHLKDVVPERVAKLQNLWEMRQLILRLRKAGVSHREIRECLPGPDMFIPAEVFDPISPLRRYLGETSDVIRLHYEVRVGETIKEHLNNKRRLTDHILARIAVGGYEDHPSLVALRKIKADAAERRRIAAIKKATYFAKRNRAKRAGTD